MFNFDPINGHLVDFPTAFKPQALIVPNRVLRFSSVPEDILGVHSTGLSLTIPLVLRSLIVTPQIVAAYPSSHSLTTKAIKIIGAITKRSNLWGSSLIARIKTFFFL
jgi:hypothetical protein